MTTEAIDEPTTSHLDELNEFSFDETETAEAVETAECDFDMEDFFSTESTDHTTQPSQTDHAEQSQQLSDEPVATSSENPEEVPVIIPAEPEASPSPPQAQTKSIYQQIWEAEHELAEICREEERLKSQLKSVKESRVEMVEKLEALNHKQDNPFSGYTENRGSGQVGSATTAAAEHTAANLTAPPCPPQTWGLEPIEALLRYGLKPAKVEALRAAADKGHFTGTVAGLRDWIAKSDLWYRDVKGCGTSGAEKIGDALTGYATANPLADEPMTPEDEARSVAAAEFLGHTKSSECQLPAMRSGSASGVIGIADSHSTPCSDGTGEHLVEVLIAPIQLPTAGPSLEPLASNVKPKRSRNTKSPETLDTDADDPGASEASISEAYLAGKNAGLAGRSCSENPFADRSSPQAKEWHRGWEECPA